MHITCVAIAISYIATVHYIHTVMHYISTYYHINYQQIATYYLIKYPCMHGYKSKTCKTHDPYI